MNQAGCQYPPDPGARAAIQAFAGINSIAAKATTPDQC